MNYFEYTAINIGSCVLTWLLLIIVARLLKRFMGLAFGFSYGLFAALSGILVAWLIHGILGGTAINGRWPTSVHQGLIATWAVLLALQANKMLNSVVWEFFEQKRGIKVPTLLRNLTFAILMLIAVMVVSDLVYDKPVGALIAASSVMTVVLGFALQNLLSDVIAGIALNVEKPFEVGDWVNIGKTDGEVVEINWRATRIKTRDDNYLVVPNGLITKDSITNYFLPSRVASLKIQVMVDCAVPPNEVKNILVIATRRTARVYPDKEPIARVKELGSPMITYEIKFWIANYALAHDVMSDVLTNVWYALRRAGMRIPLPANSIVVDRHQTPAKEEHNWHHEAELILREVEMLKALNDEQVTDLVKRSRVLHYGCGETIIQQGEPGSSLFIILQGQVKVLVKRDQQPELLANVLKSGELFGELSLLTGSPRSATVVADSEVRVLKIGKEAITPVLRENPGIVDSMSRKLAEKEMSNQAQLKVDMPHHEEANTHEHHTSRILHKIRELFFLG